MADKVTSIKVVDENIPSCLPETALYVNGVRVAAGAGKGCHLILGRAVRLADIHHLTQITSKRGERAWGEVHQPAQKENRYEY